MARLLHSAVYRSRTSSPRRLLSFVRLCFGSSNCDCTAQRNDGLAHLNNLLSSFLRGQYSKDPFRWTRRTRRTIRTIRAIRCCFSIVVVGPFLAIHPLTGFLKGSSRDLHSKFCLVGYITATYVVRNTMANPSRDIQRPSHVVAQSSSPEEAQASPSLPLFKGFNISRFEAT
ncbi:hypothetical protein B0J13DRAFT_552228, partial [Dactylonectria estremocensis]